MDLKDDPLMNSFSASASATSSAASSECISLPLSGNGNYGSGHEISLTHVVQHNTSGSPLHDQGQSNNINQQSSSTATPVISLFKLKNFLYQPKFKNLLHHHSQGEGERDERRF